MMGLMKGKKNDATYSTDFTLLLLTAILVTFGTIMVFSSSVIMAEIRFQTPYIFIIKHVIWVAAGAVAMFAFSRYDYRKLQELTRPLIITAVTLLVLVVIIGSEKGGAKRWFKLGPMSFQPSEFAKLALVIAMADFMDRKKSRLNKMKGLLPALGLAGLFCFLISLEPDLGTPVIMVAVTVAMLFVAGARLGHLLLIGISFVPLVALEILRKPYRLARMKAYLQSVGDISSSSYQLDQSILALGNGGFFGRGLAHSQMKLFYLPEPHTDFIFPIIGEETGFIGTIILIVLFIIFAWRGWMIAKSSPDFFGGMLAMGVTLLIVTQAVFNMGVATGLLPTKGLPLPFVSFGGTALVINMAGVGILLNVSRHMKKHQAKKGNY